MHGRHTILGFLITPTSLRFPSHLQLVRWKRKSLVTAGKTWLMGDQPPAVRSTTQCGPRINLTVVRLNPFPPVSCFLSLRDYESCHMNSRLNGIHLLWTALISCLLVSKSHAVDNEVVFITAYD